MFFLMDLDPTELYLQDGSDLIPNPAKPPHTSSAPLPPSPFLQGISWRTQFFLD